jgi:hypothetical protein
MKRSTREKLSDSLHLARAVMKNMSGQVASRPSPVVERKSEKMIGELQRALGQAELALNERWGRLNWQ